MNPKTTIRIDCPPLSVQIERDGVDHNLEVMGQMIEQALLGIGFHPDSVAELFGEQAGEAKE